MSSAVLDLREPARPIAASLVASWMAPSGDAETALRCAAAPTWLARMRNEHGSASVFASLAEHARTLELVDFAAELEAFAAEERRHGVLCGAVVEALGGEAVTGALPTAPYPWHADATSPLEALVRNVMSVSCLSETVAVALIGAELEEMPPGPLADLLRTIWADEIGHSRVGWRFVHEQAPRLDDAARASLGRYLTRALEQLEAHEHAHLPVASTPPVGGERYGMCSGVAARELLARVIAEVILPQLAQAGIYPG